MNPKIGDSLLVNETGQILNICGVDTKTKCVELCYVSPSDKLMNNIKNELCLYTSVGWVGFGHITIIVN